MKFEPIHSRLVTWLAVAGFGLGLAGASAKTLLLDFGPTSVTAADAILSPGHATGIVPNSEISWNKITADTSTLVYSDASAATGITLELGRSLAGVDTIDFNDNGFNATGLTGTAITTGVYVNTSPARDGVFGGSGGANNLAMGVRVNGLPAGTYTLLVAGRNSNSTAAALPERFYVAGAPSAATFDFSLANTNVVVGNNNPPTTTGFVQGDNYGSLTVVLAAGDSLYIVVEGTTTTELRGFINFIEIVSGIVTTPAKVSLQPANRTVLEGANATFTAAASGTAPVFVQWRLNGVAIEGATNLSYVVPTATLNLSSNLYSLVVSNAYGSDISSNAMLIVSSAFNTGQMTNIWNLLPGERGYLGTGGTERGMAVNPLTTNLLLVSRQPSERVAVLDPATGAEKNFLDMTGIPPSIAGVSLGLSTIGVAEDGIVYGASVTVNASSTPFYLYRWSDDSSNNIPVMVFVGDPATWLTPGLRWGDTLAVRGSGPNTQILVGPGTGTNVVLLRTLDTMDFQTQVEPVIISVSGAPTNFAAAGLAFGPGTNTFWAKNVGGALYLVQYDLSTASGTVLYSYSTALVPGSIRGIGVDKTQKFLAGVAVEAPSDNVRLYDVSDLAAGPAYRDQEVFATQNANATTGGGAVVAFGGNYCFALDCNNGIKAFRLNPSYTAPTIALLSQPANQTVLEGGQATFSVQVAGDLPIYPQWRLNGTNLAGATNLSLTLTFINPAMAGNYSLFVSNKYATALSSNALLTVLPLFNTPQMSNVWNLLPGERIYIGTNSNERGLAYNSRSGNLLLVSRSPAESVVVLNSQTGAEKYFLDVSGVSGTVGGVSLGLNMIGVADDGAVYAASLAVNSATTPITLFRWGNDNAGIPPAAVFSGDPGAPLETGLRWGDNLAVRGAGANTQVLMAPGSGTNVVLFRTTSGQDFQNEIPPTVIAISGAPSGFAQLGLAFGPGSNTFWAKNPTNELYLVQFDLAAATGAVIRVYSDTNLLNTVRAISADSAQKFLAGFAPNQPDNVVLYDISNLEAGPVLRDQEPFATQFPRGPVGGTGSTAFGGNYLFALDSNNGIRAYNIDRSYVPPISSFSIASVRVEAGAVILTWPSVVGHSYQVQGKDALNIGSWTDIGSAIVATGTMTSSTNSISNNWMRFYRVKSN